MSVDSMKPSQLTLSRFLLAAAVVIMLAADCPAFASTTQASVPGKWRLSLDGPWQVAPGGSAEWLPATVPGCIHTDLLRAGKIPDPFYRDNEQAVQWVGETNWLYRRTFRVPGEALKRDHVLLRCEGLDTLADIKINGQQIGRADNMFRTWEFDAKPALKAGENVIEVAFASPLPLMKERQAKRTLFEWAGAHEPKGRAWVRKEPCNFGWDWGPVLITCGIWRSISLEAFDQARLADVLILQDHSVPGRVRLGVEVTAETQGPLSAAVSVSHRGKRVGTTKVDLAMGKGRGGLDIRDPELWWPAGMGRQPLYEVQVELLDAGGKVIDRTTRRIGLRTLKLIQADKENSLHFEVNGIPFFAKGANWIPADAFANRVTPEILRRYVADAVAVNMNTLRFWGGGYYEEDALFDACDEMGLCVWLDFKFACSSYPAFDDAFMESVRLEARDNLRRLRHHPCIGVWCGNNEISLMTKDEWSDSSMGRGDYDKLFTTLLGQQVKELVPQASYVSGSPDCGDTHYWQVWHGGKTFDAYRSFTGFASEFGFQSFPEPKTVHSYTTERDRDSLVTPVMEWHQRSAKGNEKIRDMIPRYFRAPKDFDSALWLSQILQGYGIKVGAEYWRQTMPKSMACVFWQYNDCWPVASWSSVDYYGRWKALHYLARRFYSPILVSGLENATNGTVEVFVTSDRLETCRGTFTWTVTDPDGSSYTQGSEALDIPSRRSQKVKTLDLHELVQQKGADHVLIWLKLVADGQTVSDNLVAFVPPKDFNLPDPHLAATITKSRGGFAVKLRAEKPALWAWLELRDADAKYSDNFVHVTASSPAQILVQPARPMSRADFTKALRVRSLYDTYSHE